MVPTVEPCTGSEGDPLSHPHPFILITARPRLRRLIREESLSALLRITREEDLAGFLPLSREKGLATLLFNNRHLIEEVTGTGKLIYQEECIPYVEADIPALLLVEDDV